MKTSSLENTPVQTPAVQLARLSAPHGYRFEGDTVHLNAMFALLDPAAHERSWALQLWACPAAPARPADLAGHIVCEVSLPPMAELADETEHFDVTATARPPAGGGRHVMVLVLASGRPGLFTDVHDLAVYPRREHFIQPRMRGSVGYRLDGARVQISVDRVENPRAAANRSGTLSLELWALPAPFAGGRFQGCHLAGVEIGAVNAKSELALQPIDLAFTAPPPGDWQIVLMLREWTAAGFVTRDFTNFATRFVSAPAVEKSSAPIVERPSAPLAERPSVAIAERPSVAVVEKPVAPVIAKGPAPIVDKPFVPVVEKPSVAVVEKPSVAVVEKPATPVIAKGPAPMVESPAVPVAEKSSVPVVEKPVLPAVAKTPAPATVKAPPPRVAKAAAPAAPAEAMADASAKRVSVNTARVEELAAVKGLSMKLAEGIVKKRPFVSLDDLRQVKGLGAKILAKVRSRLKL